MTTKTTTPPVLLSPTLAQQRRSITTLVFCAAFLVISSLRFYYCLQLPVNTGDVLRHAYYGLLVNHYGLSIADKALATLDDTFKAISWNDRPYNYPVVALLFDALVMRISPQIFSYKLALTLLEGVTTWGVYRYTKQRWLALLYWASPISLWWVSHEAQFDALQNFFMVFALWLLAKRRPVAWVLLALAIQTKVFDITFVPLFLFEAHRTRTLRKGLLYFAIGCLPTLLALAYYGAVQNLIYSYALYYNPYYWNFHGRRIFMWNPRPLVWFNALASYTAIVACVFFVLRRKEPEKFIGPFLFFAIVKLITNAQFWYMTVVPTFWLPIRNRRVRWWFMLGTPLLDIYALTLILFGPWGYLIGDYYKAFTVFTQITLPPGLLH